MIYECNVHLGVFAVCEPVFSVFNDVLLFILVKSICNFNSCQQRAIFPLLICRLLSFHAQKTFVRTFKGIMYYAALNPNIYPNLNHPS